MPRGDNYGESSFAAVDGDDNAAVDDVELRERGEEAAADALARASAEDYGRMPTVAFVNRQTRRAGRLQADVGANLRALDVEVGVYNDNVGQFQDPAASLAALQKRTFRLGIAVFCSLGISLVSTTLVGCLIGGVFSAAAKPAPDPAPSGGKDPSEDGDRDDPEDDPDAETPSERARKVAEETLEEWLRLPNRAFWDTIAAEAFKEGDTWSLRTWAFVTRSLDRLLTLSAKGGRMDVDGADPVPIEDRFLPDEQLTGDFRQWPREGDAFDELWLFRRSEELVPTVADEKPVAVSRTIRMNYLARMHVLALAEIDGDAG